MTNRTFIAYIVIAASLITAGAASAQFASFDVPSLTYVGEFDGDRAKTKVCTQDCKK